MWIIPKPAKYDISGDKLLMPDGDKVQFESELLKQLLALRDYPCPVCRYNLKGIESDKCPECGASLDISLISADLKLGPWLAALLGCGFPLGFACIIVVIYCYFWIVTNHYDSGEFIAIGLFALLAFIEGLALAVLVCKRKRFWRKRVKTQWMIAAVYICISILLSAVLISYALKFD